ncbi:hypothetical protein ACOSP7_017519 [Xanthoceras sorbifolium]
MEHHREVIVHGRDEKNDTKRKERMTRRLPAEDGQGDINELADPFTINDRPRDLNVEAMYFNIGKLLLCIDIVS